MKLLIDTNIIIGLEDAGEVKESFSALTRKCGEYRVGVFVHEASKHDVERDKNKVRRAATLSKIAKFPLLKNVISPDEAGLSRLYGILKKDNDVVDAKLLHAAATNVVDFLVTEDDGLHRRAKAAGLADRIFTVAEALDWIKQTYEPDEIFLPAVQSVKAYSLDFTDPIFDEIRSDYPGFDKWTAKCRNEHRDCWIIDDKGALAGVVIRKDETRAEAKTKHVGPKILKICTFKVGPSYRGNKMGEQLLKQVLWHAQRNKYDLVYVTAYAKQSGLIGLFEEYGFLQTNKIENDELVFEKPIGFGSVTVTEGESVLDADRRTYPRFVDGAQVRKFVVPIHPHYHSKLFPEAANQSGSSTVAATGKPGNSIRKVYLCRAPSDQLRAGDLIFFYMTKSRSHGSQSLTSLGVVENVRLSGDIQQIRRWTAKRSVFSDAELTSMAASGWGPLKIIDFLLIGHFGPAVSLTLMTQNGVMQSWPQSITRLTEGGYRSLKPYLNLGFEF
jgi:ribosomal protein S18 acetylase RimI-like enzyme